ncbi:RNA polymerase sigma factor [candidate division KSB1 bacterium]
MPADERELVLRVKRDRDMVAFRQLVEVHQGRLYSLIRGIVGADPEGEDILQETLLKVLGSINQLRVESRFGPWASRIAVNFAINHKRAEARRIVTPLQETESIGAETADFQQRSGDDPFRSLEAKEIRNRLTRSLARLPKKHQTAFVLFHQNGLAVREIAEMTGWNEVTVRTYVFRAVQRLRVLLGGYYKSLEG